MPRDYAQRGGSGRNQTTSRKKGKGSGLPGWVWLFAGLSVGLAIAAFVYIGRPVNRLPAAPEAEATTAKSDKAGIDKKTGRLELPPKEKARFTFYEILPNQESIVPREDQPLKSVNGKTAPTVPGEVYFIQVASYRAEADAEKQKASLALLGAEAKIEKVTIDNKDTYFRVRIGPDRNLVHAQDLRARLEDNGIQALLVKVKI